MNKSDLVKILSRKTSLTKPQVKQVVDELFKSIIEALSSGDKFQIIGFGTFRIKRRPPRRGTNPRTGEKIDIDSKIVPEFLPGKKFLDALNKPNKKR